MSTLRIMSIAAAGIMSLAVLAPVKAQAQYGGSVAGGVLGGVLGGVIAGSIVANSRPTVVYQQRVVRYGSRPRTRVARQRAPAAHSPQGASVMNASSDPFAKPQSSPTTAVNNKQ